MKRNKIKIKKLKAWEKTGKSDLDHIENKRKQAKARRQAQDTLKMTAPFQNSSDTVGRYQAGAHLCTHVYVWRSLTLRSSGNNVA